jgi:hypothetical protein
MLKWHDFVVALSMKATSRAAAIFKMAQYCRGSKLHTV